jgi:hypothetical protein
MLLLLELAAETRRIDAVRWKVRSDDAYAYAKMPGARPGISFETEPGNQPYLK